MAEIENKEPMVQRLWMFMNHKGLTAYSLANELGYNSSEKLSRLFRVDGAKPSVDIVTDISNKFVDLSLDWWLRGLGEMLYKVGENGSFLKEPSFALPKVVVTDDKGDGVIVMLDSKAAAGLPKHINDADFYKHLPTVKLPKINNKNGHFICVQIAGDSMEPTIRNNAYVVGEFLEDPLASLRGGEICVIVSKDGVNCKRLYPDKKKRTIECVSDNDDYSPFEIVADDVLQIYKYNCDLNFDGHNANNSLKKEIRQLSKRLANLEKQLNA